MNDTDYIEENANLLYKLHFFSLSQKSIKFILANEDDPEVIEPPITTTTSRPTSTAPPDKITTPMASSTVSGIPGRKNQNVFELNRFVNVSSLYEFGSEKR